MNMDKFKFYKLILKIIKKKIIMKENILFVKKKMFFSVFSYKVSKTSAVFTVI